MTAKDRLNQRTGSKYIHAQVDWLNPPVAAGVICDDSGCAVGGAVVDEKIFRLNTAKVLGQDAVHRSP